MKYKEIAVASGLSGLRVDMFVSSEKVAMTLLGGNYMTNYMYQPAIKGNG